MKYLRILITFTLIVLCTSGASVRAVNCPYFGINATIKKLSDDIYSVQTLDFKQPAGFVFTPKSISSDDGLTVYIEIKGEKKVQIIVEETSYRGNFLKKSSSPTIHLTNHWELHEFQVKLSEETEQIDVIVISEKNSIGKTEVFQFRNVKLKHKG